MAYFAKLNNSNIVEQVVVVNDNDASTEQDGIDFLHALYKNNDTWKQTYKDRSQRKNYAGPGYIYEAERNAFYLPKPYPSWVLNETTCKWEAPVAYPDDGTVDKRYHWNEETTSWDVS
jgi:hypothetical protein